MSKRRFPGWVEVETGWVRASAVVVVEASRPTGAGSMVFVAGMTDYDDGAGGGSSYGCVRSFDTPDDFLAKLVAAERKRTSGGS